MNHQSLSMQIATLFAMQSQFGVRQQHQEPPTAEELKPEYDLIMAKKSKLSANQRAGVVMAYERLIEEVKNEPSI